MNVPKISILAPTFNHERYIKFFIESCLSQTFENFELVLVDDCSSDNNVEEIKKFQDPRIQLIRHDFNRGINAALNTAFEYAKGEFLVFLAGDDMFESYALEILNTALEENPNAKAIYPALTRIDRSNKRNEVLNQPILKREKILHELFMNRNILFSPGLSLRKKDFQEILYPLDNAMCNHQDTQMGIKLLLSGEIVTFNSPLILYRFDKNANNISTRSSKVINRENLEIAKMMETFLSCDDELLKRIFAQEISLLGDKISLENKKYFLGRMALFSSDMSRKAWGYHKVMESYDTKEKADQLHKNYDFSFKEYLELMDAFDGTDSKYYKKYSKYKKLSFILSLAIFLLAFLCLIQLFA